MKCQNFPTILPRNSVRIVIDLLQFFPIKLYGTGQPCSMFSISKSNRNQFRILRLVWKIVQNSLRFLDIWFAGILCLKLVCISCYCFEKAKQLYVFWCTCSNDAPFPFLLIWIISYDNTHSREFIISHTFAFVHFPLKSIMCMLLFRERRGLIATQMTCNLCLFCF